jgi:uncharacterized protein
VSVVSNTGPLIALAKINQLRLLRVLFQTVCIPRIVHRELLARFGAEGRRLEEAFDDFVRIVEVAGTPLAVEKVTRSLDPGERDAIAVAYEMKLPLLMDDRLGRQVARRLSIPVTGVVGVVLSAKQDGLLPSVREPLEQARAQGYWFSDELIAYAVHLAGEA